MTHAVRNDPYPDVYIGGGFSDPTAGFPGPERSWPEPADAGPGDVDLAGTGPAPAGPAHADPYPRWVRRLSPVPAPGGSPWRRGRTAAAVAVLLGALPVVHALVPNSVGNQCSLLETVLPWTGLAVPFALLAALRRRSASAAVAAGVAAALWLGAFWPVVAAGAAPGEPNLTVVSHNVGAENADPAGTARTLLAAGPDLVALEEITDDALPAYRKALDKALPHSVRIGTVALWSRHPLTDTRRVVLDPGWSRSLRAEVRTPGGTVAVYVVHLPSVRVGLFGFGTGARDRNIQELDRALAQERQDKVLLLGDLNGSTADRSLAPLVRRLKPVQDAVGGGFGFSWPAAFPLTRLDHVLGRGVTAAESWTLGGTGSDHLPVAARVRV
jgi:vancomycin resistance protein VanJ